MFNELSRVNIIQLRSQAQKLSLREVYLRSGITKLQKRRNMGNLRTTRIMMAAVRYVASGAELFKTFKQLNTCWTECTNTYRTEYYID